MTVKGAKGVKDTVKVVENLKLKMAELQKQLPPGVQLDIISEQATYIQASVAALEEHLVLSEKALTFPKDKEGCLILVREMTQLLFELLDETEKEVAGGNKPRVFTCSGCTGLIKFVQVDPDADEYDVHEEFLLTAEQQALMAKISGYPLVKAFPQNQLKRFVDCLQEQVIYSGSYLIIKGEINEHLYIILSGEVSV